MILGITPARGGSKGIKKKNLAMVKGKPLLQYTFDCVANLTCLDDYIVSTEDSEIANYAKKAKVSVPFIRPAHLATDDAAMMPVLKHALLSYEEMNNTEIDVLILLDATAPLRKAEDVEKALHMFNTNHCSAVVSGNLPSRNPYFNMVKPSGKFVEMAINSSDKSYSSRQSSPTVYDLNTVVWIFSRETVINEDRIPKKTCFYHVPLDRCIDIDTEHDLTYLEFLLQREKA